MLISLDSLICMYVATYVIVLAVAAYTYYKSLCQEKRLIDTGKQDERKIQRRRRERIVRVTRAIYNNNP